MSYPLVSAVVLNFNGKKELGDAFVHCLTTVVNSDYPNLEIVFFDNGSTDDSVKVVKKEFSGNTNLKIVGITDNCGPSQGYNKAIEFAKGKYFIILNNDVALESNSISELVRAMENDSSIGIAQGKEMSFDKIHIWNVGCMLDRTFSTFPVGFQKEDHGQYNTAFEPTFASGACLIIRKSLIDRIGLFDPNYFIYHDDKDLSIRTRLAGFKVMYIPSSIVYHKEGGTLRSSKRVSKLTFYALNSRVGLVIKNLEFKSFFMNIAPIVLSYFITFIVMIFNRGGIIALKCLYWSLRNLKNDWKQRLTVQMYRRISDRELFKYFLDYSIFLSSIMPRPVKWLIGTQNNYAKPTSQLIDEYYSEHSKNPKNVLSGCLQVERGK
jgi:GT2 family glycosyltransferase